MQRRCARPASRRSERGAPCRAAGGSGTAVAARPVRRAHPDAYSRPIAQSARSSSLGQAGRRAAMRGSRSRFSRRIVSLARRPASSWIRVAVVVSFELQLLFFGAPHQALVGRDLGVQVPSRAARAASRAPADVVHGGDRASPGAAVVGQDPRDDRPGLFFDARRARRGRGTDRALVGGEQARQAARLPAVAPGVGWHAPRADVAPLPSTLRQACSADPGHRRAAGREPTATVAARQRAPEASRAPSGPCRALCARAVARRAPAALAATSRHRRAPGLLTGTSPNNPLAAIGRAVDDAADRRHDPAP